MDILFDTHTIIWFLEGDTNLSTTIRKAIQNPLGRKLVSIVSFYEIAIKINIGKLIINKGIESYIADCTDNHIEILPISPYHLEQYTKLPRIESHKDPFDRLILATAISENCMIATADSKFDFYSDLVPIAR